VFTAEYCEFSKKSGNFFEIFFSVPEFLFFFRCLSKYDLRNVKTHWAYFWYHAVYLFYYMKSQGY